MTNKQQPFKFGTCTTPVGRKGPWEISEFNITELEAKRENARHRYHGNDYLMVEAGDYKRLTHSRRGVIMSNTPMEIKTCSPVWEHGTGRILINGLGMGMVIEALLSKPDVEYIKVIELDQDVIDLVYPHFAHDKRLEVVQASAYDYQLTKDDRYDYAWHDIWDEICGDNLKDMARLCNKWRRRVGRQDVWSQEQARRHAKRAPQRMLPGFIYDMMV